MQQLVNMAASYRQRTLVPIEGSTVKLEMTLEFKPLQYAWFMSLVWGDFVVSNLQVTMSPNILRQWKNIIPFGITVYSKLGIDPVTLEDFNTGTSIMYILNAANVLAMETKMGWA